MFIDEVKERLVRCCNEVVTQRETIEKIADEAFDNGIENIFIAGSGGSITTLMPFAHYMKKYSKIPCYWDFASELLEVKYKQLTKKSLVVIMAKTGTMVETVQLSKYCQDNDIPCVGFVEFDNTPVANQVKYKIMISHDDSVARFIPMYYFFFKIMNRNNDYPDYDKLVKSIESLGTAMSDVADKFDNRAHEFVKAYAYEPFQYYLSSGANMGEALKYSADIAEEVFQHKTQLMHCSEFFHGSFEIVDDTVPVIIMMNEDESRVLDERALKFLKKYASKKLFVIDPLDYPLDGIDTSVRALFAPLVINTCFVDLITQYMKKELNKNEKTRRYYGVVDY